MKLRLIKYHPMFAYSVGDKFEVNDADTKTLLDGGYALPLSKASKDEGDAAGDVENAGGKDKQETAAGKGQQGKRA